VITHSVSSTDTHYNSLPVASIIPNITDNDQAGVIVSAMSGHTTESGGTATFTMVLTSQPTANVVIVLSSSNTAEGQLLQNSVSFSSSDWNLPKTITVRGVNDDVADGPQSYTIITADALSTDLVYNNLVVPDVAVINDDNDTAGITVNAPPAAQMKTGENGQAFFFTIKLTSQPVQDVTIGVATDTPSEAVASPASLTFTASDWNVAKTVTVTGVDDDVMDGNQPYKVLIGPVTSADPKYSVLTVPSLNAVNLDNDVAGISVSQTTLTTSESGTSAVFNVVLTSKPAGTSNVDITFTNNNTAEGSLPGGAPSITLTFTPANWNVAQARDGHRRGRLRRRRQPDLHHHRQPGGQPRSQLRGQGRGDGHGHQPGQRQQGRADRRIRRIDQCHRGRRQRHLYRPADLAAGGDGAGLRPARLAALRRYQCHHPRHPDRSAGIRFDQLERPADGDGLRRR
jgi:hypothetical protein